MKYVVKTFSILKSQAEQVENPKTQIKNGVRSASELIRKAIDKLLKIK